MPYINANVYKEQPTEAAHECCLTLAETHEPDGLTRKGPWHWWPDLGKVWECCKCHQPIKRTRYGW